jgi:hypothetical protein
MMQNTMFSQLFDIHTEKDQKGFDPEKVRTMHVLVAHIPASVLGGALLIPWDPWVGDVISVRTTCSHQVSSYSFLGSRVPMITGAGPCQGG